MVEFKTRVYYEENNQIIGAEVVVFSEEGDNIGSIQVTSKKQFDELMDRIDGFDEKYIQKVDLGTLVNQLTIDAATLDGYSSPDFALRNHSHLEYAQTNHADVEQKYGAGTSSLYGHVKVINNLTQARHKDGVSLSAYQGKVLQDKINQSIKDNKDWKKVMEGRYTTVYYNSAIKLCQCIYNRDSYTGFKTKANETIVIHAENTIPAAYQPPGRCSVPLYDGDVTVYVRPNGSICARSLKKIDEIHLNCSWMWAVI